MENYKCRPMRRTMTQRATRPVTLVTLTHDPLSKGDHVPFPQNQLVNDRRIRVHSSVITKWTHILLSFSDCTGWTGILIVSLHQQAISHQDHALTKGHQEN